MDKVLFCFPGKIGDLVFSLAVVKKYKETHECLVDYCTSDYCANTVSLIKRQPYINDAFIHPTYLISEFDFGIQPSDMDKEPFVGKYDKIFQLGFVRDLVGKEIMKTHLVHTHENTMKRRYEIEIKADINEPYLFADPVSSLPYFSLWKKEYIVINAYGQSLFNIYSEESDYAKRVNSLIHSVCLELGKKYKVIVLTGHDAYAYHKKNFDCKIIQPKSVYHTAAILKRAKAFIGVQSMVYALAEAMKTPRLMLFTFQNSIPAGKNAEMFNAKCVPDTLIRKFNRIINYEG